jgi:hypothetical protein
MYLLTQKNVKFVRRVRRNENNTVRRFMESAEKEEAATWYPNYCSMKYPDKVA